MRHFGDPKRLGARSPVTGELENSKIGWEAKSGSVSGPLFGVNLSLISSQLTGILDVEPVWERILLGRDFFLLVSLGPVCAPYPNRKR